MPEQGRAPSRTAVSGGRLALLGALVTLGPLSTDAYVPGLPRIASDLHTSASVAQLTVTTTLVGLAVGQLFAGPLSDVTGRRRPLLAGLWIYVLAGVASAAAPTVGFLIAARGLQGIGGAAVLVIAYAMVRDQYSGTAAARAFSALMLVTGVAPVAAPVLGAELVSLSGWRSVFLALALIGALMFVVGARSLPETLPPDSRQRRRPPPGRRQRSGLRLALTDRYLIGYANLSALVFAAMFAYISGSPFVLEHDYGMSPRTYSAVFGVNAIGLVLAAQVSGRLVQRVGARRLLSIGVLIALVGSAELVVVSVLDVGLWPLLAGLFLVVTSVGLVAPNGTALALEHQDDNAGSAAAVVGFGQFFLGGLAAPLLAVLGVAGLSAQGAMAVAMAGTAAAAACCYLLIGGKSASISPTDVPQPRSH